MYKNNFSNYETCSSDIKTQLEFDEKSSDIDMVIIINNDLPISDKINISSFLLSLNKKPCPLDIILIKENLLSCQRPPIHLYFSDYWVIQYEQISLGGENAQDLLSSIFSGGDIIITELKLIKQSGICLYGISINELFPDIDNKLFNAA